MAEQAAPTQEKPPVAPQQTSSWWGSIVNTVSATGNSIYDACKEDLKEFGTVLKNDTSKFVSERQPEKLANSVTFGVASSITSVWGSIVSPNNTTQNPSLLSPSKEYKNLENDADFIKWQKTFDFDNKTKEIAQILAENKDIQDLHENLVPSTMSPRDFWERYFYRVEKQERDGKRREKLKQMAESISETETEQIDFDWGDDDEDEEQKDEVVEEKEPEVTVVPSNETEDEDNKLKQEDNKTPKLQSEVTTEVDDDIADTSVEKETTDEIKEEPEGEDEKEENKDKTVEEEQQEADSDDEVFNWS